MSEIDSCSENSSVKHGKCGVPGKDLPIKDTVKASVIRNEPRYSLRSVRKH